MHKNRPLPPLLLPLALALSWISGCSSPSAGALPMELLENYGTGDRIYAELWPGDVIDVRYRRTPELNAVATIGPDGSVNLPLVGNLVATGRTPEELEVLIEGRSATELRNPDASVIVAGFEGRAIHVAGEVESPGRFTLGRPMTVLEALILAGGPLESASLPHVMLIRLFEGEVVRAFQIDVAATLSGGHNASNVRLLPTDIVFVPRSRIANVNRWIDQYVRKNLPVSVAVRPDIGAGR